MHSFRFLYLTLCHGKEVSCKIPIFTNTCTCISFEYLSKFHETAWLLFIKFHHMPLFFYLSVFQFDPML